MNCKVENNTKRGPRSLILRNSEGIEYLLEAETTSEKDAWKKAFEEASHCQTEPDLNHSELGSFDRSSERSSDSSSDHLSTSSTTQQEYVVIPPPKLLTKHSKWLQFIPPTEIILTALPPVFDHVHKKPRTKLDTSIDEDKDNSLNTLEEQDDIHW